MNLAGIRRKRPVPTFEERRESLVARREAFADARERREIQELIRTKSYDPATAPVPEGVLRAMTSAEKTRARHHRYNTSEKGRARYARYEEEHPRIWCGATYMGRAASPEWAELINAHVAQRLADFKARQREEWANHFGETA